jgi:hypothetical protein
MHGVDPRTLASRAKDAGLTVYNPLGIGRRYLRAEVIAYRDTCVEKGAATA